MEEQLERVSSKLTVFFEDPFWVGVFERVSCGKLSAAKVTFGAEPKDYDVLEFINRNYYKLQFSPEIETVVKDTRKNPKREQRDAKKQTLETGIGTKSQQALKLQQEQNKQEQKVRSREQREAESQRIFELKKIKKREKHRGH
ncbi:MAG: YjdF family protein [Eubacterium sp.]|nr:YjdF family protein [Eubacterium sp.]